MTSRFTSYLPLLLLAATLGCQAAVPKVSGHNLVIPDRSPSRAVQALDAPSTADAASGGSDSSGHQNAYCLNGTAGEQTFNPDGSFDTVYNCAPGGGIAKVENVGQGDQLGNGNYDQTTTFEDGTTGVWHFTYATSSDFITTTYAGHSDDNSETYSGTYTALADNPGHSQMHEEWNLAAGSYVTDGVIANDGTTFDGTETFDDPNTAASPDWTTQSVSNADGSFSQTVHFVGDGFSSDYTYAVDASGHADYDFSTDLTDTQVNPDYDGSYSYNADGTGEGGYTTHFDDGSKNDVHDVINLDGTVVESWVFDDISTEQSVDQEGSMTWARDGSAEGTVTTHVVGGGEQTCNVHVASDGSETVDGCA